MRALLRQIVLGLRLNLRNRMAMIYGYLFPVLFLLAFRAIYRNDETPLVLHAGEFLTVTVLSGACFGLPTTLVGERERGVWRRYRLTPAPNWLFVVSTLAARYVLLITAALIQLLLAFMLGMPAPLHPFALWLTFTAAAAGFLGLGMVVAMMADTVPAVQALGQCIFLPMLIVGGVAVPLTNLPGWAVHLSAFLPGRYAVHAIQSAVSGRGLTATGFDLPALLLIGLAGGVASARLFRWDARQRFAATAGRSWLLLALGMWVVVGAAAELAGRATLPAAPRSAPATTRPLPPAPARWQAVSAADIDAIAFTRLPPDTGIVSPLASPLEQADPTVAAQLERLRSALPGWAPAHVSDPVQRVRNLLYVAAVPDVLEVEQLERFVPRIVFAELRASVPPADLPRILYWVAMHPMEGDDGAVYQLGSLGLPTVSGPATEARTRVMLYALKLLGRLTGHIEAP